MKIRLSILLSLSLVGLGQLLMGCQGVTTSFESRRLIGTDIEYAVLSSEVQYNGTYLVGRIEVKVTSQAGFAISGNIPNLQIDSVDSLGIGVFSRLSARVHDWAAKLKLVSQAAVDYEIVPCTASDINGVAICQVKVQSGTGRLNLSFTNGHLKVSEPLTLDFHEAPRLISVSPSAIEAGGGQMTISLSGENFRSPIQIWIGSDVCSEPLVASATQATCLWTPSQNVEDRTISLKNPDLRPAELSPGLAVVDRTAPVLRLDGIPSALTNRNTETIRIEVSDLISAPEQISLLCALDGGAVNCSPPQLVLSGLSDGLHSLAIHVRDQAGNSSSQTLTWVVDTLAPNLAFDASTLGSSPSASAAARLLSFGGSEVVAYKAVVRRSLSCAGVDWSSLSETNIQNPFTMLISTDGDYVVCAVGRDSAGNWQSTALITPVLSIDTSIPYIVSITGALATPSNQLADRALQLTSSTAVAYKAVTLQNVADCSSADFSGVSELNISSAYTLQVGVNGNYLVCAIGRNSAMVWQSPPTASSILSIDTSAPIVSALSLGASPSNSNSTRHIQILGPDVVAWKALATTTGSCDLSALNNSAVHSSSELFSFTPSADGTYQICAIGRDAAGNWQASPTLSSSLVIDRISPSLTFVSSANQNQASRENSTAFSGTCENGLDVQVTEPSGATSSAPCDGGVWTYPTASQTTDGLRTYQFRQMDAAGNATVISGVWKRDATPPTLTLNLPVSAGQILDGGSTLLLRWTSDEVVNTSPIRIEYSTGGLWMPVDISFPTMLNTGSYSWMVPALNSSTVRLRLTATDNYGNSNSQMSPVFAIDSSAPIVNLTALGGGQLIRGGSVQTITWNASDDNIETNPISLSFSANGGASWQIIASGLANTGSYNWTAPMTSGTAYVVRVTAVDKVGHSSSSMSGSSFAIDGGSPVIANVSVNGQNGGITVSSTSSVSISWSSSDPEQNLGEYPINLYYSANGGSTWNSITTSSIANGSSYTWALAGLSLTDRTDYQVKVEVKDKVGNTSSSKTSNFSVLSTAPVLTFANGTNTNSITNSDSVTFSGTCTNTYGISVSGTDGTSSTVTCSAGSWTWTSGAKSSDGRVTYSFSQTNGAFTSAISASWTRDTLPPSIGSILINGGAASTTMALLALDVTASDANMSGLSVQLALANIVTQVCPVMGASWSAFSESGNAQLSFNLMPPNGTKSVCVWIRDAAGNTASGKSSISFDAGTAPSILSFNVYNGSAGSINYGTSTYETGDTVAVSWSLSDAEGLSNFPVYLDYSVDGSTWVSILNGFGGLSGNPRSYAFTSTIFSAPSGLFYIRIRARDSSGNWAMPLVSVPQNAGRWGVFAGSTDRGIGSGAFTAVLASTNYGGGNVAINPATGDIYALDLDNGYVKISGATGLTSSYIRHGSVANLSNAGGTIGSTTTVNTTATGIVFDGGYLYLLTSDGGSSQVSAKIWRIDPRDDSYVLYIGGGNNITPSASSTAAFVAYDAFRFDEDHSLYYFGSCASNPALYNSTTDTVRLMKVAQNPDGTAGAISVVAGNCVNGNPISGNSAVNTPLGDGANFGISQLAVWDRGNKIYYRLHGKTNTYKILKGPGHAPEGTLYSTSLPASNLAGLAYNPTTNLIYHAAGKIMGYTPSLTGAGGEVGSLALGASTATSLNCSDDGLDAASESCDYALRIWMGPGGQLYLQSGYANTSGRPYRIRYLDSNGKIWTLAGSMAFAGDGQSSLFNRGSFRGIFYKPATPDTNLSAFPSGLYFTDPRAGIFGRIDNTGLTHVIWGNQSTFCSPTSYTAGVVVSKGMTVGCTFTTTNPSQLNLTFDREGLPWLRPNGGQLLQVSSALFPTLKTNNDSSAYGTAIWMYADPATASATNTSYVYAFSSNFTMKDTSSRRGFFSLGAYYATGNGFSMPGAVLRYADLTNNRIVHIMGDASITGTTADSTTPSDFRNLSTSLISVDCQTVNGNGKFCYTRFVENDPTVLSDDLLYFTEGSKIRMIQNPLTPGSQILTTVLTEDWPIQNFIPSTDNRRLYYFMNGLLYCYALSRDYETSDCRNRKAESTTYTAGNPHRKGPLGPPSGMSPFPTNVSMPDAMTWKDDHTLLLANGKQILYYNVPQPSTVTKNMAYGVGASMKNDASEIPYSMLASRNIKAIRSGVVPEPTDGVRIQNAKSFIRKGLDNGFKINFLVDISWIAAPPDAVTFITDTSGRTNGPSNRTAIYQVTKSKVKAFLSAVLQDFPGVDLDFELGNEISLKVPTNYPGSPNNWNVGWSKENWKNFAYANSTDYFTDWAYAMKAAADAIEEINAETGRHHRRMVNVVGTQMAFLDLLLEVGVKFEMISYHYYYLRGVSGYSLAAQTPGSGTNSWNLFGALAAYRRPVVINEFNCAEIYNSSFTNQVADSLFTDCVKNIQVQFQYMKNNGELDIEAVYIYELIDNPTKINIGNGAESRFGLFWWASGTATDPAVYTSPKPQFSLWTALAGGVLSQAEIDLLQSYGLWPLP